VRTRPGGRSGGERKAVVDEPEEGLEVLRARFEGRCKEDREELERRGKRGSRSFILVKGGERCWWFGGKKEPPSGLLPF